MSRPNSINPSVCWSLPLLNILFGMGLCLVHVHAEAAGAATESDVANNLDVWSRLTSGPFYWSTMDKVLFVALVMLALEILNFLCNHSGGTPCIVLWLYYLIIEGLI